MNVLTLRKAIEGLDDDTPVVTPGYDHDYRIGYFRIDNLEVGSSFGSFYDPDEGSKTVVALVIE